jgi:hypothetical protein
MVIISGAEIFFDLPSRIDKFQAENISGRNPEKL